MTPDTGADQIDRAVTSGQRRRSRDAANDTREADQFDQQLVTDLERRRDQPTGADTMATIRNPDPTPAAERIATVDTLVPRPDLGPDCHTLVTAGYPLPADYESDPDVED